MAVTYGTPKYTFDAVKGLWTCEITVSGNTIDPNATKTVGVGDTKYQAKRHAVVTYEKENPLAFKNVPADA